LKRLTGLRAPKGLGMEKEKKGKEHLLLKISSFVPKGYVIGNS